MFFPLDEQLQVWDKHWSEQVAKHAVWLSGLVEYEAAENILNKIGQVVISDSSVWRRASKWGAQFQAQASTARAVAIALPSRQEIVPGEPPQPKTLAVALDGAMVNIRTEGWKELKVGCLGEVELRPQRDPQTGEMVDLAHSVRNSYVAHLGGPEVFGQLTWAEARRRGWSQACETIAVGDGAAWVWNLVKEHFYDSRQCVDWYHATSHLSQAAALLHGDGTPAAHQWRRERETLLFEGHANQVAHHICQAIPTHKKVADELRREAGYFADNQRRMQYLELREDGLPIGSGMVESGCKQFQARFKGPGMRWSRPGLERLLPVRAAIMSKRFDETWNSIYKPPPN